ncbi:MAG: chemotaxis protein CheW [Gammaproteobacteria bacterium]
MAEITTSVPSLLLPLNDATLLLPNAAVAEVVGYADPQPVADVPDWLQGVVHWRGFQLPLVAFEQLMGGGRAPEQGGARIAVLNTLNENPDMPFFAMALQGIPRLLRADGTVVTSVPDGSDRPTGVLCRVLVNGETMLVPDLDAIERMLSEVSSLPAD